MCAKLLPSRVMGIALVDSHFCRLLFHSCTFKKSSMSNFYYFYYYVKNFNIKKKRALFVFPSHDSMYALSSQLQSLVIERP